MTAPDVKADPVARMAAYGLATVGGLMLGLSGLCSLGVLGLTVAQSSAPVDDLVNSVVTMLATLGFFGGIPMLIGFFALRHGLRAIRVPAVSGRGSRLQLAVGLLLLVISVGGLGWAIAWSNPLAPPQYPGSNFYTQVFIGGCAFFAALVSILSLSLIVDSRPAPKRPPSAPPPG